MSSSIFSTKHSVVELNDKKVYQLDIDFNQILFDKNFKPNLSNKYDESSKTSQIKPKPISEDFMMPYYYNYDEYESFFEDDLDFIDSYANIPNDKEISKLLLPIEIEPKPFWDNYVIPNYPIYDTYDSLFVEDLIYCGHFTYEPDVCDLYKYESHYSKKSSNKEELTIKKVKPVVSKSEPFISNGETFSLDKYLRN